MMSDGQVTAVPAAQITVVDIFSEQVKMGAQLAIITEQLKAIPDHEARIRALEKWRYSLPMAIAAGVGSVALSIWSVLHR